MATLTIEYPDEILVSLKETQDDFSEELKIAEAVKLYEMGKLTSVKNIVVANTSPIIYLTGRMGTFGNIINIWKH